MYPDIVKCFGFVTFKIGMFWDKLSMMNIKNQLQFSSRNKKHRPYDWLSMECSGNLNNAYCTILDAQRRQLYQSCF